MLHGFTVMPWMTLDFINVPVKKPEIRAMHLPFGPRQNHEET
jgi:hypothetical protein